jgi:Uncharacterized protein conserved in bacteria (DUF2272)
LGTARPKGLLLVLLLSACAAPSKPAPPAAGGAPHAVSLEAAIPPFARDPYEPFSRAAAVAIAKAEWRAFYQPIALPHTPLPSDEEREEGLWQLVGLYWWIGLGPGWVESAFTGKHDARGQVFPAEGDGNYAWSAAFISYVMRLAGAGNRFPYTETHSDYINAARRHALGQAPGIAITTERPLLYPPELGDLICAWRDAHPITYDDLPTAGRFPSHCDIVVGKESGLLDVIGGNVENAVAMKRVPVTADGRLVYPNGEVVDPDHHWFVVIRVLYAPSSFAPPGRIAKRTSRARPLRLIAKASAGSRRSALR